MSYQNQLVANWDLLGLRCYDCRLTAPHVVVHAYSSTTWYLRLGPVNNNYVYLRYHDCVLEVVPSIPKCSVVLYVKVPQWQEMLQRCAIMRHITSYSLPPQQIVTWMLTGQIVDMELPTHPYNINRWTVTSLIKSFMH